MSKTSLIEEMGSEITWEILGTDSGWYVWASHNGDIDDSNNFRIKSSGKTLDDAIVSAVEELLAIGPEWVRK